MCALIVMSFMIDITKGANGCVYGCDARKSRKHPDGSQALDFARSMEESGTFCVLSRYTARRMGRLSRSVDCYHAGDLSAILVLILSEIAMII